RHGHHRDLHSFPTRRSSDLIGETVDQARVAEAIRSLYKTGFFQDVEIARDGNTLVVGVVERPSIASIDVHGNKAVTTEDLLKSRSEEHTSELQSRENLVCRL